MRPASSAKTKISISQDDITKVGSDVIVNAANSSLQGGGGVDGAIHRAAGPSVMKELRENYDFCPTGEIVVTGSGKLSENHVKKIFHAVGPIWKGGQNQEEKKLLSCYRHSLEMLNTLELQTIAFPAISTGIYGYPIDKAAESVLAYVIQLLNNEFKDQFEVISFILFSRQDYNIYLNCLNHLAY